MSAREFRWPFPMDGRSVTPEVVDAAWSAYRATGCESARETLLQRYIHLVRYMASRCGRTLPSTVDGDDLISAGLVGLLGAFDTFKPDLGTDFSVYALTRIRGSIVDFTREIDPVGRVTRRRLRQVARALGDLEQELGREPTDTETARRLDVPLGAFHELMARAVAAMALSLEAVESNADDDPDRASHPRIADGSLKDPLTGVIDSEVHERLTAQVNRLPRGQQLILHLHYVEALTFREVAMVMDISESRTSQLHSTALQTLRTRLANELPGLEGTVRTAAACLTESSRIAPRADVHAIVRRLPRAHRAAREDARPRRTAELLAG